MKRLMVLLNITANVLCFPCDISCFMHLPVSEGRREFGELMEGEELDFVCETDTQLLL